MGRGREWGTLVHRVIAAMGRGRAGEDLRSYARAVLRDAGRPVRRDGEPTELADLMELLGRVARSDAWRALAGPDSRWELTLARHRDTPAGAELVMGAVDALRLGEAPALVDWKTDAAEFWAARSRHYAAQLEAYRILLKELAGVDVDSRLERVASS